MLFKGLAGMYNICIHIRIDIRVNIQSQNDLFYYTLWGDIIILLLFSSFSPGHRGLIYIFIIMMHSLKCKHNLHFLYM